MGRAELALATLLVAAGCAGRPPCPPARPVPADAAPFLWEVRSPDGGSVLYLFGTVHVAAAADVPASAWAKLAGAPAFVAELPDLDPETFHRLSRLPAGPGLDQLLAAGDWYDLRDALLGKVREDALRRLRPWYAMSLLTNAEVPPPDVGMDAALSARARRQGARLVFLETWAEQLAALNASVGVADLAAAIHERHEMRCVLRDMLLGYRAGDLAAAQGQLDAAQTDTLLAARNARWLPQLEAVLADGGGFVAVGLGHLTGPRGLPALLAARGYAVRRLARP